MKTKFLLRVLTLSVSAALACSCEKPGPTQSTGPAASSRVVGGPGIVRGKIIFTGAPPVMKNLKNDNCCEGAKPLKEETVIVGPDKGLANCFIWIDGIGPAAPRGETPVIDQIHCQYVPHVVGIAVGQKLSVRSSDPTIHNVNFKGINNSPLNFGMMTAGLEKQVSFGKAEIMPLKCDVHPWMIAYVGVFENSYFAATKTDGAFEIKDIPAGSYKVIARHELYGQKEQSITIDSNKPVEVNFSY